jgi:phosphoglycolate phosphatase-like HAD superfamily hydrolase
MVFLTFSHQLIIILEQMNSINPTFVREILTNQIDHDAIERIAHFVHLYRFSPDYTQFVPDFSKGKAQKQELLTYLNDICKRRTGIKTKIFSRNSELWKYCQETFQEWYVGEELVEDSIGRPSRALGKRGFLKEEIPLVTSAEMKHLFSSLKEKGYTLGIGTGRPKIETEVPLNELEVLQFFEMDRVVTASDVLKAEEAYPEKAPLAKPHPFSYLKGYFTKNSSDSVILAAELPLPDGHEILIIGDSVADYLAAKAMGAHFAATLTGLSGEKARATFEELKVNYIINDVRELLQVLENKEN